jgi:hypothetical protein
MSMNAAAQKNAIVLHGPPATGKSQIWEHIKKKVPVAARISLDDGWGPGEIRYRGGTERYLDLAQAQSPVLVVELGWGEPAGLGFPGATRAAQEWVRVLRDGGRQVYPFLLRADFTTALARLKDRQHRRGQTFWEVLQSLGIRTMYEQKHELFTFPQIQDFSEVCIDTSNRDFDGVAKEIISLSGLATP